MELVEGFEEQTVQVFENLKAVIEASGGYLHDVAAEHLPHRPVALRQGQRDHGPLLHPAYPARAAIGVAALPKGAQVEMDAIVVLE